MSNIKNDYISKEDEQQVKFDKKAVDLLEESAKIKNAFKAPNIPNDNDECLGCDVKEDMKQVMADVHGKNKFLCIKCADKSYKEEQLVFDNEQFNANYNNQYKGVGALLNQLLTSELSKTDIQFYQYLWVINGKCKNIIFDINKTELALKLHMQKSNISRSINKLIERDILEKLCKNQFRFTIYKDLWDEDEWK